jgi:DHA2 family multidrug resistance protein-like MFS transporter
MTMADISKTETISPPPPKAGRKEWVGLGVIALPCLLYSMDLTVLNLAVPHIVADLKPSATQLLWIVDIYGFMIAGALITMGTLGDRIGRRKLLLIGAVFFGLASILAAFSNSAEMLIVARALLGLSAATLAPSTLSLISNMFPDPKERTFAIGVWISSFSAGGAIGPLIGGVLLTWFWWGSVFLIAVPIMILLLAVGPWLLPEYRDESTGRIDLVSAALSVVSVLAVIYGMKHWAVTGFDISALGAIAVGLNVGAIFLLRQRRLSEPFMDLALFRMRKFSAALGINVIGFFAAFGTFLLSAQYLQLVLGLSPLKAGLVSLPSSVGFIAGSMLAPKLVGSFKPAQVMAGGYVIAAAAFVMLAMAASSGSLTLFVLGYLVMSAGLAPIFTLSTDLIVGSVPPERAGTASGLAETSSEFGGALGIAALGSIVTMIYAGAMSDFDVAGVTAAARETIGGALDEASRLGRDAAALLVAEARVAYAYAFQVVSLICAGFSLVACVMALVWLGGGGEVESVEECGDAGCPERAAA